MIQAPKFIYGEEKNVFRDALRVRPWRLVERNTASSIRPLNLFMGIINFDY